MRTLFRAFILAMTFVGGVAVAAQPFTYQDMMSLDRVSALRVDGAGQYALFQVTRTDLEANSRTPGVWLKDLNDPSKPERLLPAAEGGGADPRFGPNGGIYFLKTVNGVTQLFRTDNRGERAVQVSNLPLPVEAYRLLPNGKGAVVAVAVFPDCGGDEIACTSERKAAADKLKATGVIYDKLFVRHWNQWKDGTRNHLFYLPFDAQGVAQTPVPLTYGFDGDVPSKPFGDAGEFIVSGDSRTVYFSARHAGTTEPWNTNFDLYAVSLDAPAMRNLTAANPAWDAHPRLSPDGKSLAFKAMTRPGFESDRFGLYVMDLATGDVKPVAAKWDRSVSDIEWSKDGKSLLVSADDLGHHRLFRVDIRMNRVVPLSRDGHIDAFYETARGFVFLKSGLTSPSALYRANPKSELIDEGAQALTRINEGLKERTFGEYEQFTFRGWNNETVHGYVIKPANYEEGRSYPVAFLIHGGPQGSFGDMWSFRWNMQSFAGAGYAVVMIDFHGSTGYGQTFTDSISQHWGDRPLEDLQKGWAHALRAYPFLDGNRACALGGSYGGYMVNWIAGNWNATASSPGFKCLVNHAGVFDTRTMAFETEELWFMEWEMGGIAYDTLDQIDRFNPALHARNWTTPMLVIHGDLDYRVVPGQGVATFTALQRQGIKSRFLRFPDEGHWINRPQNSRLWYEQVLNWLGEHTQ